MDSFELNVILAAGTTVLVLILLILWRPITERLRASASDAGSGGGPAFSGGDAGCDSGSDCGGGGGD